MASSDRKRFAAFDVVIVPFPYADRLAEKRRPALVISGPKLAPYGLIWVAMITSAENEPWPSDVLYPISNGPDCLRHPSCAREDRLHRTRANRTPRRTARQGYSARGGTTTARFLGNASRRPPHSHFFHLKNSSGTTAASTISTSANG